MSRKKIALVIAALAGMALLPPVQARGKAVAVLAEALGAPFPRPFAAESERRTLELGGVEGDLYESDPHDPAVLLLPGAAPAGKDDPRAIRLAYALARAGRTVFVPSMRLAERRFELDDIDDIRRATIALHDRSGRKVLIFGISYGGSFALMAAADPTVATRLEKVAVFGAYFDLLGLVQAASTGVSVVGDRRIEWDADPRVGDVLREAALELAPSDEKEELRRVLESETSPSGLSDEARAVHRLVTNDDPDATFRLAQELGPEAGEFLKRFSPAAVAEDIEVPVIAIHSTDDPVTPYGEAIRLQHGLSDTRLVTVSLFDHVDMEGGDILRAAPDLLRTWTFASWLLAAQG